LLIRLSIYPDPSLGYKTQQVQLVSHWSCFLKHLPCQEDSSLASNSFSKTSMPIKMDNLTTSGWHAKQNRLQVSPKLGKNMPCTNKIKMTQKNTDNTLLVIPRYFGNGKVKTMKNEALKVQKTFRRRPSFFFNSHDCNKVWWESKHRSFFDLE